MALRAILKYKTYSLITIAGLAMGMAGALLILLYIRFESSFDSFHANAPDLYRVSIRHVEQGKVEGDGPYFSPPLGPAMAQEIPGVTMGNFLRTAWMSLKGEKISVMDFMKKMKEKMSMLKMDPSFSTRYLNEGFSGGEKKRAEILQMAVLEPEMAILDETDSGLDIDALKIVSEGVNSLKGHNLGVLIITHYQRILNYIRPDRVHILVNGKIAKSGGADLAHHLEEFGYDWLHEEDATGQPK